ncbi:MAG: GAF domain protein [candidate division BRC1 bacterium ADurb.BinA364]|nr:MAG: GAF domain protein [candidate division BRC1 bacterium ADurb.BinA364]
MFNQEIDIAIPDETMQNWQEIVDLLAQILKVPAALIMRLRESDIEVFVASQSAGNPYHPGERERLAGSGLYCETVIATREKLLVPDALADPDWKDNPDIKINMVSYLGFPLLMPNKKPFGTICVLDRTRNEYSAAFERLMLKFRGMIESHIELLCMNRILGDKNKKLTDYLMEIQALRGFVPICSSCKKIRNDKGDWHPVEHYLIRHPQADFSHGICPDCMDKLYPQHGEDV